MDNSKHIKLNLMAYQLKFYKILNKLLLYTLSVHT